MRSLLSLIGLLMALYGVGVLGYQALSDTKRQMVDQWWPTAISSKVDSALHVQPLVAQVSLGVGIVLIFVTRRR